MSWLDALFQSINTVEVGGITYPQRSTLDFVAGSGATIVGIDQPNTATTEILISSTGAGGGGAAGGDLSGSYPDPVVAGFQGYPLQAPTTPGDSDVYVWNGLHFALRQLTQDDIGPAFAVDSFSGGSTVEIGATVTNPSFSATYSSLPSSAQITNTDSIDSPLTLSTPFTSGTVTGSFTHTSQTSVTFTLTAIAATTQTAEQFISYEPRMFGGVAAAGATGATASGNSASLTGVSGTLSNAGLLSTPVGTVFGPYSPSSQVIYLLLTGNSHTFKDNSTGFAFPFNSPTSVSFVNQNGATVSMYLYQSTNTLTGTYSIEVVT
jgi:hypothetical protein